MKHLFIFLLPFAAPLLLNAQEEYPFLESNLQWVEEHYYSDGFNPDNTVYLQYNLAGDTLIDGFVYRKLMVEEFYQGALREEPGKLLLHLDGVETTLLDFTLTVGDTIFFSDCDRNNPDNCQLMRVETIDSVEVLDGSLRKRLNFEVYLPNTFNTSLYYSVSWIDGIGSTWGIIPSGCGVIGGGRSLSPVCEQRLVCVQDTNNLLYNNTEDQIWECSERSIVSSSRNDRLPEESIMVSPNPALNGVSITAVNDLQFSRLRLQDITGKVLIDQVVSPLLFTHQLSLLGLSEGFYFLTAFTNEGKWATVRLVKQ